MTTHDDAIRKALGSTPRPSPAGPFASAMAFAWRGMLKVKHVPEQLLDVTITPVMFLLMFTYIFGGAIAGSTQEYLQYILPGTLVMSVLFTTVYSGVALNTDLTRGVVDRIRTLPIWRPSPLVGALLGDSVRYLVAGTVIIVLGLILGFDPEAGVGGVVAALALVVVFAFGLSWVFTTLGLVMRSPNAVMNAGFMAIFPLTFLSNVFVEPDTLPGPARVVREREPDLDPRRRVPRAHGRQRRGERHPHQPGRRGSAHRGVPAADDQAVPQSLGGVEHLLEEHLAVDVAKPDGHLAGSRRRWRPARRTGSRPPGRCSAPAGPDTKTDLGPERRVEERRGRRRRRSAVPRRTPRTA